MKFKVLLERKDYFYKEVPVEAANSNEAASKVEAMLVDGTIKIWNEKGSEVIVSSVEEIGD